MTMTPIRDKPRVEVVTFILIGINVAVYVGEVAYPPLVGALGGIAERAAAGQYYRLVTSAFLHEPLPHLTHLMFNMLALWRFGRQVERVLGRGRYLVVYALSAAGGSAVSYAFLPPQANGIGASGAIFGLFGALIVLVRRAGLPLGEMLTMLAINLVFSFLAPHIDWYAHLGGLVAGAVVTSAMVLPARARRGTVGAVACLAVACAAAGTAVYRSAVLAGRLRNLPGSYTVTGTLTGCTGFTPADCAKSAALGSAWTIDDCGEQRCTISGREWEGAAPLTSADGHWRAAGLTRTFERSSTCGGAPAPTADAVDLTPRVVDGVETLYGTVRMTSTPWGCRPSTLTWQITGTR
ncbi:rhomboid family intramembrane serine protease [Pseudonocardia acaciae]|uniref:rhomboid family intramembrane serine protease n=1 Tax=Pseudonocardia acaciae TaxID=551276 RepID=UPI000684A641|nr:rhomboid family intramembrane serine protease [Pseudonocardia acaciae]